MSNTLLLVEDEPLIGDVLELALADAGFRSHRAFDVDEAFVALQQFPNRFCAAITDVNLGGQDDGWKIARQARAMDPEIPIIYISGHAENDWRLNGVENSVFLSKPFAPHALVSATLSLVNRAE
jgi:DNA-binding response OmpR family regulator